ncbi:Ppx/GppA phosphatase family protein [Actinopolymorpha singaporensis]|uniref:Ppx/GppA phosphatase family protein n=1 Tax=Actinopolymorpha singaporensis TaxID=117157 RepID=UPI0024112AE3|nr:hypothetical protein [Actinopolymorpha singaporensis]
MGPPVRVAAVDCGTNSIRLLVADITTEPATGTRHLHELDRRLEIVRLGEGVDRTGRLSEQALARTFAACERYAERIRELGADQVRFVATSASRDADNRAEFVTGIREILGVEPEVITGAEEADLSFAGATRELAVAGSRRRTSSSTSAAAPPSSSSAAPGRRRRSRSTWAAYD